MRPPLPPELLVLGDHLETATRRQVGSRHTRRHMILNALASLAIAVPLVATTLAATRAPAPAPIVIAPNKPSFGHKGYDSPPRLLVRVQRPNEDVLYDDTTLRRALR